MNKKTKNIFFGVSLLLTIALAGCKSSSTTTNNKTDQAAMLAAFNWQEANPIQAKSPTDWTNGAYYTGVVEAHKATGNKKYLDGLVAMGGRNGWQPWERFYHADDLAICYSYLYLKEQGIKNVDLAPTETIIYEHLHKDHVWKQGGENEKKILWWWCDALFMAPPVLTEYAKLKKDEKYLDEMYVYYKETYDLLFDQEEKLFARDARFLWTGLDTDLKEDNGNKIFWSRGNGWVLGGLALLLDDMPKDYEHRDFFVTLYKAMAQRIKELQPEDGLWRVSLLAPEAFDHGEVSGSGFYTFALAWGINTGLLDKDEYGPTVKKAWTALKACQQDSGKVGWVQNIGASPEPASVDSWQNFGTGAFLMAGSQMIQLK